MGSSDADNLTPVQQTLFLTLYGRALDSRTRHPILGDTMADELVGKIDTAARDPSAP